MLSTLIAGNGEVGSALARVLSCYNPVIIDKEWMSEDISGQTFDILHICFPWSNDFEYDVKEYQKIFKPKHTVIHSTVAVGTSRQLGAIHSPIRGQHQDLEGGIRTFVKFIGGEQSSEVADYFRRVGIKICLFDKSETTEAMKLFDTEYFRVCIEFTHRVKKYCDEHELNFTEVYKIANITYNEGYEKLGRSDYVRPVLEPIMGKLGGHCLSPNKELIKLSEDAVHKRTSIL